MKKSFIVIGLGRYGANVARTLASNNADLIAMDISEDAVAAVKDVIPHCVIADSTNIHVLEDLGVKTIDHAVVSIGNNLQASVLTLINLVKLGVKQITIRADDEDHRELYERLGATEIIVPEEQSAIYLANQILSDSILEYYIVSDKDNIVMVHNKVGEKFEPKSLIELNLRNKYKVNIVGMFDDKGAFYIPSGDDKLAPGKIVVVVGKKNDIKKFDDFLNS